MSSLFAMCPTYFEYCEPVWGRVFTYNSSRDKYTHTDTYHLKWGSPYAPKCYRGADRSNQKIKDSDIDYKPNIDVNTVNCSLDKMLDIINIIINKLKKVYNIITSLKGENNEGKEDKKEKDKENNILNGFFLKVNSKKEM